MLNELKIEGILQSGWQGGQPVTIRETETGKKVVSMTIVNKYGKEEQYSAGYMKVNQWVNNGQPLPDYGHFIAGDRVYIEGRVEHKYRKHNDKEYIDTLITAESISLMTIPQDYDQEEASNQQPGVSIDSVQDIRKIPLVKESEFDFTATPGAEEIPF